MALGGHEQQQRGRLVDPARFLTDLENPGLVSAIDLARWLAAAIVAIGHARFPLLKGYGLLGANEHPLWVQGWYFVTGYFVEAVLVFFVVSGFLVGGMASARLKQGSFDPPGYAVDRFSRLYTSYLPALLLSVLLTWIGMTWFDATGLYSGTNPTFVEKDTAMVFADAAGWRSFFGNLFMLQYYFTPPYGANPPLWTLSSEFWFYAVFGLAAASTLALGAKRWLLLAVAAICAVVLGPMFWLYLGMWLIGLLAAIVRPPRLPLALPATALLIGMLLFRRYADAALAPSDALRYSIQYGICIATALLLLGLRGKHLRWAEWMAPFNKAMADFSYSLYLIHFPLIILFVAALGTLTAHPGYATGFSPTNPLALATYAGELVLAFGGAWLFSLVTERHTAAVRGRLKRALLRR